jgi:hypothetical protein
MKRVSLRILVAMVLSLMGTLFDAGSSGFNGATDAAAHIEEHTNEAVLGQDFKIKYGQELAVKGEDLKVKFASVEDSRCPIGVTCVWEGDAKVLIDVRRAIVEASQLELHTSNKSAQWTRERKYQQYVIRLVALYPHPTKDGKEKASDYVATLLIKKE